MKTTQRNVYTTNEIALIEQKSKAKEVVTKANPFAFSDHKNLKIKLKTGKMLKFFVKHWARQKGSTKYWFGIF